MGAPLPCRDRANASVPCATLAIPLMPSFVFHVLLPLVAVGLVWSFCHPLSFSYAPGECVPGSDADRGRVDASSELIVVSQLCAKAVMSAFEYPATFIVGLAMRSAPDRLSLSAIGQEKLWGSGALCPAFCGPAMRPLISALGLVPVCFPQQTQCPRKWKKLLPLRP